MTRGVCSRVVSAALAVGLPLPPASFAGEKPRV